MERVSKWIKVRIAFGLKSCVYKPGTLEGGGGGEPSSLASSTTNTTATATSPPLPVEVNDGDGNPNLVNSRGGGGGGGATLTHTLSSNGFRFSRSGFRSSKKVCSICLASMQAGKGHALFTAECSHTFHFQCIASNVKHGNHACPICRAKWKEVPFEAPSSCNAPQRRDRRVNPVHLPQGNETMTILHRLPRSQSYNRQQQHFNNEPSSFADDEPLNQHQQSDEATCQQHRHANEADMKVFPEFSAIPCSSMNDNLAVLIHLKSPMTSSFKDCDNHSSSVATSQTEATSSRAPVDLVTVLDISGSMAGTKLALVKQAMGFVIQNLGSSDRLSVVTFSSTARRLFHLRRMTESGRQEALQAVNSLICSGGTNIAQGLKKGAKVVQERREKNPVCSIILLSDGQDTYRMGSIRTTTHLHSSVGVAEAAGYGELLPHSIRGVGIPVHAFGFGADHDSMSMHSISETSGGTFSFIEAEDTIQDAFAQCIGGLLSVVVQRMLVSIECVDSVIHIQSIKSGSYTSCVADDKRSGFIRVGDLYAEEERDFLAFANVPPLVSSGSSNSQETTELLRVGCSYIDPLTKESIHLPPQLVTISRPDVVAGSQDAAAASSSSCSMQVDRQKNRLLATEAMVEARAAAERGELSQAISILEHRRQAMFSSASGQSGDDLCRILDVEMREMQERMTSRQRYEACGRAYVLSGLSSHSWQRATARGVGDGGGDSTSSNSFVQTYQTTTMIDMVQRSQTLSTGARRSSNPHPIRPSLSFPASR